MTEFGATQQLGVTRILPVPYFTQPKGDQCQSTVLRMYAQYLDANVLKRSSTAGQRAIGDIFSDINKPPKDKPDPRPQKDKNNHQNMMWWLGQNYPTLKFEKKSTKDAATALWIIRTSIDSGFPLMASVSHENVEGHIVLIVGYDNLVPEICKANVPEPELPAVESVRIVVHDPYGAFDPSLKSKQNAKRRWEGGQSLVTGSERGPGTSVAVPLTSVSRRRKNDPDWRKGNFELMTASQN
jgi:hypothetical protein